MIGRVNTGGGSGCILTITAVASETVTISKNGKSKSKTADSKGVAVFRGLDTGKWTITIVRGGVPITRVVAVTADYSVAIPLFAATINITYPAGSSCTCSDGTTTLSAPDTSGTWACIVPNAGTWTVTAMDGEKTKSKSIAITANGQSKSVTLAYTLKIYNLGWTGNAASLTPYAIGRLGNTSGDLKNITVTYSSGNIVMNRGSWDGRACAYTDVAIDLTGIDTLFCTTGAIGDGNDIFFGVGAKSTVNPTASVKLSASSNTYSLDVSAMTGEYRIGFYGPKSGNENWTWNNRKIAAFWGE